MTITHKISINSLPQTIIVENFMKENGKIAPTLSYKDIERVQKYQKTKINSESVDTIEFKRINLDTDKEHTLGNIKGMGFKFIYITDNESNFTEFRKITKKQKFALYLEDDQTCVETWDIVNNVHEDIWYGVKEEFIQKILYKEIENERI